MFIFFAIVSWIIVGFFVTVITGDIEKRFIEPIQNEYELVLCILYWPDRLIRLFCAAFADTNLSILLYELYAKLK